MSGSKKKVVILAYDFPPYVSVGGIRPFNWYKFLHVYDVYPIVITRQWTNTYKDYRDYIAPGTSDESIIEADEKGCIIRIPYHPNRANRIMLKHGDKKFRFIRKLITVYYELAQFLFHVGPKAELYRAAKDYLKKHPVDVIIATGGPFILFKYAADLSKQFGIPWLPDYRDSWTNDPTQRKNLLRRKLNAYVEKKIVSGAAGIITVSKFIENHTFQIVSRKPSYILPNGYDPDAVKEALLTVQQNSDSLHIGYAGTIPDWAPLESFLKVCNQFLIAKEPFALQLNFFGIDKEEQLMQIVATYPLLKNIVKIHPKIPNTELLKEFSKNNLFLLFNYYSMMGTKIYDYIALKRKTLLCYSKDQEAMRLKESYYHIDDKDAPSEHLQEDLLEFTQSGVVVKDADHLMRILEELYKEFKAKGMVECQPVNEESLSRKTQTAILADIIKETKKTK